MTTRKDPAQEFAERVEEVFWENFNSSDPAYHLRHLIANELRAGGWLKLAKPVKGQPRDIGGELESGYGTAG